MLTSSKTIRFAIPILVLFIESLAASVSLAADQKPEDIVAKHLESIGPAPARAAAVSRVAEGKAEYRVLSGGSGNLEGKSALVSQGKKLQFMMKFPNNDYRGEQFICDGSKTQITATTANHERSRLGEFVRVQDAMLKEGLLGGVLSTAWPLGDLADRKAKLSFEGTKKVDGKDLYVLRYKPKKSSDMDIRLFFDPDTFHHVMTTYSISLRAGLGHVDEQLSNAQATGADLGPSPISTGGVVTETSETATAHQSETRYRLEERFSNFQTANGLTLPSHYRIQFTQELKNGVTTLDSWDIDTSQIVNGTGVDARNFEVK